MSRKLMDEDGENLAVRVFLNAYATGYSHTVGSMMRHMSLSGFPSHPGWLADCDMSSHLTTFDAQLWLRYLFDLEKA